MFMEERAMSTNPGTDLEALISESVKLRRYLDDIIYNLDEDNIPKLKTIASAYDKQEATITEMAEWKDSISEDIYGADGTGTSAGVMYTASSALASVNQIVTATTVSGSTVYTANAMFIMSALNDGTSRAMLQADKIDFNGYSTFIGTSYDASSEEEMTDTSKVYKYTGATTASFTKGTLYRYNGTSWVELPSNSTVVDGYSITTGMIRSYNFAQTDGEVTAGTEINLLDGSFRTKSVNIDSFGNASFKGNITAEGGGFTGRLYFGNSSSGNYIDGAVDTEEDPLINISNNFMVNKSGQMRANDIYLFPADGAPNVASIVCSLNRLSISSTVDLGLNFMVGGMSGTYIHVGSEGIALRELTGRGLVIQSTATEPASVGWSFTEDHIYLNGVQKV